MFRLITRLDVKPPHLVKGIQLEGVRKLGKPVDFAEKYYRDGADELFYQDVVASLYGRNSIKDLIKETSNMFGKILITHQTGPQGKKVKRLYIEEASEIRKEFYLACLVDRASSKIAFISSTEGGMEIENIAKKNPEKIITTKFDLKDKISVF